MRQSWRYMLAGLVTTLCAMSAHPDPVPGNASLTVEQIVDRHLAARGGAAAWRAVQTMSWTGRMDAGSGDSVARSQAYASQMWTNRVPTARSAAREAAKTGDEANVAVARQVQLPFLLEMKRPGKARIELEFAGKTAIQVYDGNQGWMKRPFLNRDDWEPFSAEQAKVSMGSWDLDGPLLDGAAKGSTVTLVGVEKVDGSDAYKLKVTRKDGSVLHVWIDLRSYLDVRIEGAPRRMDGRMHAVWIAQRDFRQIEGGIKLPFLLETTVDGYRESHAMRLEKVAVNPRLDDARFTKSGA